MYFIARKPSLLLTALIIAGCSVSEGPEGTPGQSGGKGQEVVPPSSPPPDDPWNEAIAAINESPIANMRVIIGDETGILLDYEKGDLPAEQPHRIASASKMMIGAAVFRLVERGVLSLDDNPQDYISWWTNDPEDLRSRITLAQLLSSVSGFNDRPIAGACPKGDLAAADECVRNIYEHGLGSAPGEEFHYGPEHLDVAQHMAALATGMTFDKVLQQEIAAPLGLSANTFLGASSECQPSACEPFSQSEAYSTAADYAKFLQALFAGNVVDDIAAFTADRTQSAIFVYRPASNVPGVGDWHYALASWRECDLSFFSGACATDVTLSSPGAFGWTPWIDFHNGYYALIAHEDANVLDTSSSLSEALQLEQSLQPLIERVLANN